MKTASRQWIGAIGAIIVLTATAEAQVITVVGRGDAYVDIPAVQAAVDQGGRVVLKGHFSFDAPPTVPEVGETVLFSGAAFGTIGVSKEVAISGARDDQGEMPAIEGGVGPFYVEAPEAHVTIQGLRFIHSKVCAIRVVAAKGLVIAANRVEGVRVDTTTFAAAFVVSTSPDPKSADLRYSENISGRLSIANNHIDVQGTAGSFLGLFVFAVGRSPNHEVDIYVPETLSRTLRRLPSIFALSTGERTWSGTCSRRGPLGRRALMRFGSWVLARI